jgi:ribonuclease BN (tRNA processing enzyme)
MFMEIILLGTGTAVPLADHTPAAILFKAPGLTALLDIGPGAIHRLALQGFDPFQLEYIFLTHLHSDHSLDLATFLQMNDSAPGVVRSAPLYLTGPRGLRNWYEGLMRLYPGISPQNYPLHIRELAEEQFELDEVRLSSCLSGHTTNSLCYRFDTPSGSVVYTGDCVPGKSLVRFCAGVDLLICECSFPDGWTTSDHMNAHSVGTLAQQAQVKRLVATHLYPPAAQVDLQAQIRQYYAGPVSIARDGATFSLP